MKIALINPRNESCSSFLPPLGVLYIGAVLEKEGFYIRIFDITPSNEQQKIKEIVDFRPDIVGVSIVTVHVERAKQVISTLKRYLKFTLIIGGVHCTALPEESLDFFEADCVVIGEGEYTMKELCSRKSFCDVKGIAYRKNGSIIKTGPREPIDLLDELPFPARRLIDFEKYLFPPGTIRGYWSERCTSVMTSRGCPFQCIWCGTQTIFGHKVRRRSVDNVIKEIEFLQKNYKIDSIWFVDDTFTLDRKWVVEFCNKLIDGNIRLKWGAQAHVTTIDAELLSLMRKAGLVQIDFGVESGSDKVLRALKKGSTVQAIKKAFYITKKAGVRRMASFMFGNPEETEEDVKMTFRLAKEIKPDFVSTFYLTPFPGTELMEMAKSHGWLLNSLSFTGGITKLPQRFEPLMEINFSIAELLKIKKDFQREFLWRNFSSFFFNPRTLFKMICTIACYPKGLFKGLSVFLKTKVFDDLVFTFLVYRAEQIKKS